MPSRPLHDETQLQVTQGQDKLVARNASGRNNRVSCGSCCQHLYNETAAFGVVSTMPELFEGFKREPGHHIHCKDAVLDLNAWQDGLPRFDGLPPMG